MKFDEVLVEIGECGWYQMLMVVLLDLPAIWIGMQVMGYIFTSAIPNYRCYVNGCDNLTTTYKEEFLNFTTPFDLSINTFSRCHLFATENGTNNGSCPNDKIEWATTHNCDKWKYDKSDYIATVVTQFNLVCDKENLVALAQSVLMVGIMFGGVAAGMASDRYGRKKVMISSILLFVAAGITAAFAPNYPLYLVLKFFIGASGQAFFCSTFVMSVEFVGKSYRSIAGISINVFFALGEITFSGFAYWIRNWKILQIIISAPPIIFLLYYWLTPESPRWLLINGKVNEAAKTLTKIARSNGKTLIKEMLIDSQPENQPSNTTQLEVENLTWLDLFRNSHMRLTTMNLCIQWFMITLAYYGTTMTTSSLGGNQYANFAIVSAIEIPAYLFGIVTISKFGRRRTLCFSMIFGGLAGVFSAAVPSSHDYLWLRITLATIGKFGAAASFGIVFIFTAELYPTALRNSGIAVCVFVGHLGSVIAPYIARLVVVNLYLPLVVFGLCCVISGLTGLSLPETLGKMLPETVKDCEDLAVCSCCSRCKK